MADPLHIPTDPDQPPARPARRPRVLIVQTGRADPSVHERWGDYPDMFGRIMAEAGADWEVVVPLDGEALPYGGRYEGIIITGSAKGVREEEPWMAAVGLWALAMAAHTPVLAVCFGHQLVGEALGGRVEPNPLGPEWGTVDLALTEAGRRDPLFAGIDQPLRVQQLHRDVVLQPPQPHRYTLLSGTAHTALQAFAVGPWLRAVQFHPELQAEPLQRIMHARGWTPTHPVQPSDHGTRILHNWVRHYVRRAEQGG